MFQIFFVYILIQSVLSNGLTNHDLCMKDTNTECNAMHSYECKPNKCSISERVCDDFKRLEYVLSSFRSRRTYDVQIAINYLTKPSLPLIWSKKFVHVPTYFN